MISVSLVVGFFLGALFFLGAEVIVLLALLHRIRSRKQVDRPSDTEKERGLDCEQSLAYAYNKQGVVWVLEPEKVPKFSADGGAPVKVFKEQKSKKDIVEVHPVKKYAKIKDHFLVLTDSDGSQAIIHLSGCTIEAVSASSLSSRKWSKRYPVRVENKSSQIYSGSNNCFIYFETSWEKESWCRALRLASSVDKQRLNWYFKLNEEFHHYVSSLAAEYPIFLKPSDIGHVEKADRDNRIIDGSSSKVRLFLKKLAKKASKNCHEYRAGPAYSSFGPEERKPSSDKVAAGFIKSFSLDTVSDTWSDEAVAPPYSTAFSRLTGKNQPSVTSDTECGDKFAYDEGVLCWNLLLSRLFFDARSSTEINRSIRSRIQRTLSNLRTPSFIGAISCTNFSLGNLPPYFHSMRVLPMDVNEAWAIEIDIEYCGGAVLDIETRLEVREPEFQKGIVRTSLETKSAGNATSDLLEDFEHYGKQLKLDTADAEAMDKFDDNVMKLDGTSNSKNTNWKSKYSSRWKSILKSVADQVSQVPLSLAIRITTLRGTLRLHIKPPPSDQLWFGFTRMPNIDWVIDSAVGDHKITSGQVAMIIGSRIKAAIRETLVLPNCETVCIPWMFADKDDWIPRNVAPFMWIHQEGGDSMGQEVASNIQQPSEDVLNTVSIHSGGSSGRESSVGNDVQDESEKARLPRSSACSSSSRTGQAASVSSASTSDNIIVHSSADLEELKMPLLITEKSQKNENLGGPEHSTGSIVTRREQVEAQTASDSEEAKPRMGRRARMMMDLGKKMGEKLEEKRRHFEEKADIWLRK